MLRLLPILWLLMACVAARHGQAARPGHELPRVTLRLDRVTAEDAVRGLSRHTGHEILLRSPSPVLADLEWSDVSLGRAVGDVARAYRLAVSRGPLGEFILSTGEPPPDPSHRRGGVAFTGGTAVPLRVECVEIRSLSLQGADRSNPTRRVRLELGLRLQRLDPHRLLGLERVRLRDERGREFAGEGMPPLAHRAAGQEGDDTWSTVITAADVPYDAGRLASVTADLTAYRTLRPIEMGVKLPLEAKSVRLQQNGLTLVVSRFRVLPEVPAEGDEPDLPQGLTGERLADAGPCVRVRCISAPLTEHRGWETRLPRPIGIDRTGKRHAAVLFRGGGTGWDGRSLTSDSYWIFPEADEPLVRLEWRVVERADPERVATFTLTDLPLPGGSGEAPPQPAVDLGESGAVEIRWSEPANRFEAPGTLSVGVAARRGTGFGPLRWHELSLRTDGTARLTLPPGIYRLTVRWKGSAGMGQRDLNATVQRGVITPLPPIRGPERPPKK